MAQLNYKRVHALSGGRFSEMRGSRILRLLREHDNGWLNVTQHVHRIFTTVDLGTEVDVVFPSQPQTTPPKIRQCLNRLLGLYRSWKRGVKHAVTFSVNPRSRVLYIRIPMLPQSLR